MRIGFIFSIVFFFSISYLLVPAFVSSQIHTENNPPLVRITAPLDKSRFAWNSLVTYSISITDKEDGNSAYDEIPGNEVLLKVVYLADPLGVKKYVTSNAKAGKDPVAISLLQKLNCFTCHSVRDKLIGPSFEQIAKRYPYNPSSLEALTGKVINGSSGVWGNTIMPPQPEIKKQEAKLVVDWILRNAANVDTCYYTGLQGAFRTRERPGKGVYVLTASYTDHGISNMPKSNKSSGHTIVLNPFPLANKFAQQQ